MSYRVSSRDNMNRARFDHKRCSSNPVCIPYSRLANACNDIIYASFDEIICDTSETRILFYISLLVIYQWFIL